VIAVKVRVVGMVTVMVEVAVESAETRRAVERRSEGTAVAGRWWRGRCAATERA
jgi:hypothetical protein